MASKEFQAGEKEGSKEIRSGKRPSKGHQAKESKEFEAGEQAAYRKERKKGRKFGRGGSRR